MIVENVLLAAAFQALVGSFHTLKALGIALRASFCGSVIVIDIIALGDIPLPEQCVAFFVAGPFRFMPVEAFLTRST